MVNMASGFECPNCGCDTAATVDIIYLDGDMDLTCYACGEQFEYRRDKVITDAITAQVESSSLDGEWEVENMLSD